MAAAIAVAACRSGCRRSLALAKSAPFVPSTRTCAGRESKAWNESFRAKPVSEKTGFTEYEKFENPPEWRHVEALLFNKTVPKPAPKEAYPSRWKPPDPERNSKHPYYVQRSRNHMLPVYLQIKQRGIYRFTRVSRVLGDLKRFEEDLKEYLTDRYKSSESIVVTRRDELNCFVEVKGDYVIGSQKFLLEKGF